MSSINYINKSNSPTENILVDYIIHASNEVYKRVRFDIGDKNTAKLKELILINEAFKIEDKNLRELIIKKAIKTIKKL